MSKCIALIVGAGRGQRFGDETPKQYHMLDGVSIIARSIATFSSNSRIAAVRAVIHFDDMHLYEDAVKGLSSSKLLEPVQGGTTRQQSVYLGLQSLKNISPDQVLIHDAARPFVSTGMINSIIGELKSSRGAIVAIPVYDTLKSSNDFFISSTIDRSSLWCAQTPQGFHYEDIYQAYAICGETELTDDAAVFEKQNIPIKLVEGTADNIKITSREDLMRAERVIGNWEFRSGTGYDVHRFCDGNELVLCGVKLAHCYALEGHSDADVALHALTDALLGAFGLGDIGTHFPPNEKRWKNISSDFFLVKARDAIEEKGASIVNVDVTIICEEPKISSYREVMRKSISTILNISKGRVSVKATTTEKLGFLGRKEGIAAEAVATIKIPIGLIG